MGSTASALVRSTADRVVGRHGEQAWLDEAFELAEAGQPRVRIVAGDAGIGKTRLVHDALDRRAEGWLAAVGHCVEAGEHGLPYAPVSGILRAIARSEHGAELLADVRATVPGLLPLVESTTPSEPVDTTTGLNQLRLLDALTRLLEELSRRQPTVVVFEDLHWADPSTRALVSFLCRNLVPLRLVLILTVRTDELRRANPVRSLLGELVRLPGVDRLDLQPLAPGALGELLSAVHGTPLPRAAVRRIADRSGGNPFFAEQLLAAGGEQDADRLPIALVDVLRNRADCRSPTAKQLMAAASLAGQRIDHDVLLAVSGLDEETARPALEELADAQLLEPEQDCGGYRFRHTLMAETVAGDLLPAERRRLHGRFAEVLANRARAACVTGHLLGADDLAAAFPSSCAAAEEAHAVAAPSDELAHWERALDLWSHGSAADRSRVGGQTTVCRLGALAAKDAGAIDRAIDLAQRAIETAVTPIDRARARLVLAPLLTPLVTGSPFDEVDVATAAIADAEEAGDPELVTRGRFLLARAHFLAGRFAEAAALADTAAIDGERLGLTNVALGARTTTYMSRCDPGDGGDNGFDQTVKEAELIDAALACDDVETGLWVLTRLADWWWPIDLHKGEDLAERAYGYATRHGVRSSVRGVWARETLVLCRLLNGNWDAVEELSASEPLPVNDLTAATIALETQVEIARGRLDRARLRLELTSQVTPDALGQGFVAISELSLRLAEGDPAAAVAGCVERLDRLPPSTGFADIEASLVARGVGALADALEAGIDPPDGPELLAAADRIERRAREQPNPRLTDSPLSLLLAQRSRLEHTDVELWRRAVARRADRPYHGATCRLHLAQALLAAGDTAAATEALQQAAEACSDLGAVVLRARIEEFARRARISLGAPGPPSPANERWNLTDREAQVLQLLAEGRTNRRIGEVLFISEKTVSVHVSNILAKLHVANRGEAAAIAHRYGLVQASSSGASEPDTHR